MFRFIFCILSYLSCALFFYIPSAAAEVCTVSHERRISKLFQCDKIRVLVIKGTPVERAREMGVYLQEGKLSSELIEYFYTRLLRDLKDLPSYLYTPLSKIAEVVHIKLAQYIFRSVPKEWTQEIQVMADAMGIHPSVLERATLLADFSSLAVALTETWPFRFLPAFGCTSLAKKTDDNKFFVGRNLDFASVGIWDKLPLLVVHIPPDGSTELAHVAIGADGLNEAGITGVNSAGITFAVHQNFTKHRHFGIPMPLLGEMMLRKAQTIEEAIQFLKEYRPGPIWTFVISNLKTGEAVAIESGKHVFSVRKMEGNEFAQTNHAHSTEARVEEWIQKATLQNSILRKDKVLELLRLPNFSLTTVFETLAYQENHSGNLNSFNDILKPLTIQTAIFESTVLSPATPSLYNSFLYLSEDEAPTASGYFLRFSLSELFSLDTRTQLEYESKPVLDPNSEQRKHQIQTAKAMQLYFDENNKNAAAQALSLQNSIGAQLFFAIVDYQEKRFQAAANRCALVLKSILPESIPHSVFDSFAKIRLLSLWQLKDESSLQTASQEILSKGTDDPDLLLLIEKIQKKSSPPIYLRYPSYDFFSGNLRTQPKPSI